MGWRASSVRSHGVSLPGNLAAQRFDALLQPLQLLEGFLIVGGSTLQLLNLLLDVLQFRLRVGSGLP